MKRYAHLYEQITSVDNCRMAILNAAKHKKRRKKVQEITANLDYYAEDLSQRLQNLTFLTPYIQRTIHDHSSGKLRELQIPAFYPDQCAHHAIVQVLQPIIMKSSYYWSCANIPGRGIDHACIGVERATERDKKHAKYCLKLDIRKFYPSILHPKLMECLERKIKDKRTLLILQTVIRSHDGGLPIGNYTSPWLAELFLQPLDRLIKQDLKIRHYIRYADDLVLIDSSKRKLHRALKAILQYAEQQGFQIKRDYQLFKIQNEGSGRKIDFVGRCFGRGFVTVRKRRALALMRQSRRIQRLQAQHKPILFHTASGFLSRCSCFNHTNSKGLQRVYLKPINIPKLKEVIRNESQRQCKSPAGVG